VGRGGGEIFVMTPRFYLSSFLFLLAILSGWLVWHFVMNMDFEESANPNNPDSFVKNIQVVVMNENGLPDYQFNSPHMLHYSENDRTTFDTPHVLMYENNQSPWMIDARQGEALHGSEQIKLWGNISMVQSKSKNNTLTRIHTEEAWIYPKTKIITTDKTISAVEPTASVEGVGMKLDLLNQTLDLFSEVKGYYVQPKK
jgi:lipopolysaccharide export system protein LptC